MKNEDLQYENNLLGGGKNDWVGICTKNVKNSILTKAIGVKC